MVQVKFCGITNEDDATMACQLGCDFIGLNFHESSPRFVDFERASRIAAVIEKDVQRVGVFVDPTESMVQEAIDAGNLDILQFHGAYPATFCEQFDQRYIRCHPVTPQFDFDRLRQQYASAWAFFAGYTQHGEAWRHGATF